MDTASLVPVDLSRLCPHSPFQSFYAAGLRETASLDKFSVFKSKRLEASCQFFHGFYTHTHLLDPPSIKGVFQGTSTCHQSSIKIVFQVTSTCFKYSIKAVFQVTSTCHQGSIQSVFQATSTCHQRSITSVFQVNSTR